MIFAAASWVAVRGIRTDEEQMIANALYAAPAIVGTFQDRGIRYDSRKDDEEPIEYVITSLVPLLGLPGWLFV